MLLMKAVQGDEAAGFSLSVAVAGAALTALSSGAQRTRAERLEQQYRTKLAVSQQPAEIRPTSPIHHPPVVDLLSVLRSPHFPALCPCA